MTAPVPYLDTCPLSPGQILARLDQIVCGLACLNDLDQVKALSDQTESIRYLTKKLRYDLDIQNVAAEAAPLDKATTWGTLPPSSRPWRRPTIIIPRGY